MMNPRCAIGMYSETNVVSFPPCGPDVEVKAAAAFPFSLPWNHRPPRLSMNAFNSADVLPKRVGVPKIIPSAHSTSACVGAPYSASILLLRSSQPGTLAITSGETISGTRRSRTSAPAVGLRFCSLHQPLFGVVLRQPDTSWRSYSGGDCTAYVRRLPLLRAPGVVFIVVTQNHFFTMPMRMPFSAPSLPPRTSPS